jgi:class 3 adenylate cyclase/tetratricopeptide (TPR) repeat protein
MLTCPRCGQENPEGARFCLSCGNELSAAPAPSRERKVVSILFVDLVGFTSRSDRADPEDVQQTLQRYHARVKDQLERHGGTVEKFIGDAVMAVFGAPVAHGDDPERAVRAGLRALEAIQELNREDPDLDLSARAAVTTGEAVVAVGTAPGSGEALAIGDVVNTASRLQSAAPPGQLVVGEETYRATRGVIAYEEMPAVEAKGKRDPVRAWLALAPVGAPAERPVTSAPIVGRDRELAVVASIWDRAVTERRPHLVTLLGPPGIGKSRLAREISASIDGRGGRVLRGRCYPYDTQAAYGAFGQQVRRLVGAFEQDPPAQVRDKVATAMAGLLSTQEAADVTRSLSLLLGLGLDEPMPDRTLLFLGPRRLIEELALDQPTLFVFEDIHWADAGDLDLIEYLAARVRDTSAVFLALARPELHDARPTWASGLPAQTTLALEPLAASEGAAIAAHILGAGAGVPSTIARLLEVAGGNPLFIEELTASSLEGGEPEGELPTTIRAAIASRLDALPPGPRAIMLDASVIGRTFWKGALRAVIDSGPEAGSGLDLEAGLDALEARDLIRRQPVSQVPGDVEFAFKHILIRDVAYATLPRESRRDRHRAVAQYIEDSGPDQARELAWLLAHHWREAGEPDKAIGYLLIEAERARDAWGTDEAVELFDAALALAGDESVRRRVRLARGLTLVKLEEYQRGAEELRDLLPELEGREELEALLAGGGAEMWTERNDQAMAMAERAVALAERLDDPELLPLAIARLSQAHGQRGEDGDLDRARELGDRALSTWVPGTRNAELAEHNVLQADIQYWTGAYENALERSRNARALAIDPTSAEMLLRGSGTESLSLAALGLYEQAIATVDRTIALGRELGRPVGVVLNYSTLPLRDVYDLEEARARTEEAVGHRTWSGFQMPRLNSLVDLLATDLLAGEVGPAQARWNSVWEEVRQGRSWQRWLLGGKMVALRAEIELRTDNVDDAVEWGRRAVDMARSTRRRKYETVSRLLLGRALLALGRTEEALAELQTAVSDADELRGPPGRWRARAALGSALYAKGDDGGAEAAFREAAAVIRDVAAGLSEPRAARFLAADEIRSVLNPAL